MGSLSPADEESQKKKGDSAEFYDKRKGKQGRGRCLPWLAVLFFAKRLTQSTTWYLSIDV
jgi:hypothetical protein